MQGDSGHAQADMVTEVYGHIIDEGRRKNTELMENVFYNKDQVFCTNDFNNQELSSTNL